MHTLLPLSDGGETFTQKLSGFKTERDVLVKPKSRAVLRAAQRKVFLSAAGYFHVFRAFSSSRTCQKQRHF